MNPDVDDSGRGVRQGNLSVGDPTHETGAQRLRRDSLLRWIPCWCDAFDCLFQQVTAQRYLALSPEFL